MDQGLNQDYLPVWLQQQNIKTYYIGKLMNAYSMGNFGDPYPNAWTNSSFLVDPWTYNYHKSRWTNQQQKKIENHSGEHTTTVTQAKALDMLEKAAKADDQFFMMIAPVAPHVEIAGGSKAPPAPRGFGDKFTGEKAPRLPNFNPDVPSGASWVHKLEKLNDNEVGMCDKMHVQRLRNINAIDHMVGLMLKKLQKHKILDNTYIIYTSDNGFHIGNHRMKPGKRCGYEEDINVPFIVRGPNVPRGVRTEITNSHTDVAPTILKMMGVPLRQSFDGQPIAYTKDDLASTRKGDYANVEYWDGIQYGWDGKKERKNGYYDNGTFKALRMNAGEYSFLYSVWCTNEHEFYDMNVSRR